MYRKNHWLAKVVIALVVLMGVFQGTAHENMSRGYAYASEHRTGKSEENDHDKGREFGRNEKARNAYDSDKHHYDGKYKDHDDIFISLDAGEDQVVNAGDKVYLEGKISYRRKWGEEHKYDSNKYRYRKRSNHFEKRVKYDDHDNLIIRWHQKSGTKVHLIRPWGLKAKFVAPTPSGSEEILVFTLTVKNRRGKVIASDRVEVKVQGQVAAPMVSGRITAIDGTELPDISINVLSSGAVLATGTSGANGDFSFELPGNSDFVLAFRGDGYAYRVLSIRTPGTPGSLFLDITMIMRASARSFFSDYPSSIFGEDGAGILIFSGGSFVDENGTPVTGYIDARMTPVDVSRRAYLEAFPGEFSGVLAGDTEDSPFYSLGAVEFDLSQDGQPVQLAAGKTAEISIPIYFGSYLDGTPIQEDDSIPLWSLNEDTGIWEQETVGTVVYSPGSPTGLALRATVDHLSWWNCDVNYNPARALVSVTHPEPGTVRVKGRINDLVGGWLLNGGSAVTRVNSETGPLVIPSRTEICFSGDIYFDNGSTASTAEECITALAEEVVHVVLQPPASEAVKIFTIPESTEANPLFGSVDYSVDRVRLLPSTIVTAVSYTIIDGELPPGLSLNAISPTRAEIVGVPTQEGLFDVTIQATDSDGNTDTVTIYYDVTASGPGPG